MTNDEQRNSGRSDEQSIVMDRARELLEASSDSILSELDRAAGWLWEAEMARRRGYWQMEGPVGSLGALTNAWGRLTLWARADERQEAVENDLHATMEELVLLRRRLMSQPYTNEDLEILHRVIGRLRQMYGTLRGRTE